MSQHSQRRKLQPRTSAFSTSGLFAGPRRKKVAARRLLRTELLEPRMLLAAYLSPSPTIVPLFDPENAIALTSPIIEDWTNQFENDFPILNDEIDPEDPAEAPLTNGDTFRLHSNPGSTYTIYLDFDGAITEGTNWNNNTGIATLVDIAYDRNSNPGVYSDSELNELREIWRLVSEDFAPFDVNVTTEDPGTEALKNSGASDFRYGIRSIHTSNLNGVCSGCGGVAFVGSFDSAADLPAYNFNKGINAGGNTQSHEVGHTVSLSHDGLTTPVTTYYGGHGSGATAWGPIMGGPSTRSVKTWSNGDYFNANQQQDDLNRIVTQNGFGYRDDDHGNTFAVATPLEITGRTALSGFGIIERNTDVDLFSFETAAGNVSFTISPHANYQNLDVWAGIYDSTGALVAESNPSNNTAASFSNVNLAAGKYFIKVDGVGTHGFRNAALDRVLDPGETNYTGPETTIPWNVANPVGYSDYASVGQYWITGTRVAAATSTIGIAPLSSVAKEGSSGTTPFTFRISRVGSGASAIQVDYAVETVTPDSDNNIQPFTVNGADFMSGTLESGVAIIPAGQSFVDLTINVAGDNNFERDEHFQVAISDPTSGWTISNSVAAATILSDESAVGVASLLAADAVQYEGDPATGGATYTYTLFRRGDTSVATTANWQVQYVGSSGGGPANNADFVGSIRPSGTVTFLPGQTELEIEFQTAGDLVIEGDQHFAVAVTGVSGSNATRIDPDTPSQRGIILEDESPVTVIDQVQFRWRQNNSGTAAAGAWAIDNVSLSGSSFNDDFDPAINNSLWAQLQNATVNSDAAIFPGTNGRELLLTGTGQRFATSVGLQPTAGSVLTFDLILGNGTDSNGAANVANGKFVVLEYSVDGQNWQQLQKFLPDDYESWTPVTVTLPQRATVTPKVITEGSGGTTSARFNIVRTGNLAKPASATWQVVPSGTNPIDLADINGSAYPSGTVNFAANNGAVTITVPITADLVLENDETFNIVVTSTNAGPITGGPRTITIVNDDTTLPPNVTSVVINDGAAQRSSVKKIDVVFDSLVNTPASAFSLTNLGSLASPASTPVTGLSVVADNSGLVTIVTMSLLSGQSLPDANFRLDIIGAQITPLTGGPAMTGNYVFGDDPIDNFFRNYGDADGDGFTDFDDFSGHFLPAFGTSIASSGAAFRSELDFDNDGDVDFDDFAGGFLPNFGTSR